MRYARIFGQFLGTTLFTSIIGFVLINNLLPIGLTTMYSLKGSMNSFTLGPKNRVVSQYKNGQEMYIQTHDLIYFSTPMPFQFDSATVNLTYQNYDPNQTILVGFQDQEYWHYNTLLFDAPFLNALSWKRIGVNPTLYQRNPQYDSVSSFLLKPPQDSLIGTYNYDTDLGSNTTQTMLANYSPATQGATINTPLRGRQVLYVYLHNEPFIMTIKKQDLNWYGDVDSVTVSIYKNNVLVYSGQIPDDGISNASRKVLPAQELTIRTHGKKLPENGVYKIILDANSDTIITQIKTNLHKIVFQGSLFPVGNKQVYPTLVTSTSAITAYTNAIILSARTYHTGGLQDIIVEDSVFHVNSTRSAEMIVPRGALAKLVIPKSDVVLNAFQGYFSFSPDQFFIPIPYNVVPIQQKEDIEMVDNILANYTPSMQLGDSEVSEHTFNNLSSAVVKNGSLTWVIEAPSLQENNRQIIIKNITVTFHKNAWL